MNASLSCLGIALFCALPACGGLRVLAPNNPIEESGLVEQFRKQLASGNASALVAKYSDEYTDESVKVQLRNDMIAGLVLQIDNEFEYFASRMLGVRAFANSGLDTTAAGLAIASTLVDHVSTAKLLAGVGAGVLGLRLSIDKEFFYEQSTPILVAQMNRDRDLAFAALKVGMVQSSTRYPLAEAVRDLGKYYQAGTLFNAFAELSKRVSDGSGGSPSSAVPRLTVTSNGVAKIKVTFTNKLLPNRSMHFALVGYAAMEGGDQIFTKTVVVMTDGAGVASVDVDLTTTAVGLSVKRVDIRAPTSTPLTYEVKVGDA